MGSLDSNAGLQSGGWLYAGIAALFLSSSVSAASTDAWGNARILYFEPFTTTIDPRPALAQKSARSRQLKFDAHGRRFDLTLEPNEKLQRVRDAADTGSIVNLYRGQLSGVNGSWARIATRGSEVHGLVWDGAELYVIEPSEDVRASLVPPLDASNTRTVLFRLSDTIVDAGASMCAVTDTAASPTQEKSVYASLSRELDTLKRSSLLMQAGTSGLRLELSAIGDAKFREQFASDAEALDAMLLRLNNVDGIFEAELGIEIHVPTAQVFNGANDPLPATTSSTDLLEQLGSLRQRTPELQSRGLTHLFTGRDLDGTTVGIGYVNALCRAKFGVALTEIRGRGAWLESLITAHEIGHNFGSVHDGEAQCNYVAQNQFLMSPTVHSNAATFSSCSRDLMMTSAANASCITSLPPADLSINANLGTVHGLPAKAFEWEISMANLGGRAAQESRIEVLVPPTLSVSDVYLPGGACTSGAGTIACEIGDVPGGSSRSLHMTLSGDTQGTSSISARVLSLSDADLMNNTAEGSVVIAAAQTDASVTTVQAPAPPASLPNPTAGASTSSGGGGSFGGTLVFSLLSLAALRRRR